MFRRQVVFFLINGLVSLLIAYSIYFILIHNGVTVSLSNSLAYVIAMLYGFFANRKFAFNDNEIVSNIKIIKYIILYSFTLILNVNINSVALDIIAGFYGDLFLAFFVALSISTVINFIGMKYWVFKPSN
jgi:putative flippase GtrA